MLGSRNSKHSIYEPPAGRGRPFNGALSPLKEEEDIVSMEKRRN